MSGITGRKLILKYSTDLVITNTEIAMRHNAKIVKMNPFHDVGSFTLTMIYQKNNSAQNPGNGNNFTKDQPGTRTALMYAKRN